MSYLQLVEGTNIVDNNKRYEKLSTIYSEKVVTGLHYVFFSIQENTLAVCLPNHQTNHYATSFLLLKKYKGDSINTVRSEANDLKKFLDFLLVWDIDITDGDLLVILSGFVDYLCLLSNKNRISNYIEWALTKKLPLSDIANSKGKLSKLTNNEFSYSQEKDLYEYTPKTIKKTLQTVVKYIHFLKKRTIKYQQINLNELPIKIKNYSGLISGTAGQIKIVDYDVSAILRNSIKMTNKRNIESIHPSSVINKEQFDYFISNMTSYQDKFIFLIMGFMGLRVGEVSNIKLDLSSLPPNFINMDYHQAIDIIKSNFKSDFELFNYNNSSVWLCHVVDRGREDFRALHKKKGENRTIPWLFGEDTFVELLYFSLIERELLMQNIEFDHGFLFVSRDRKALGNQITGQTILKRFRLLSKNLLMDKSIDITKYSPHTFRHFFASYFLKELQVPLDDVSRWLGHATTAVTKDTYLHWIPSKYDTKNEVSEILNVFKSKINRRDDID